MAFSTFSPLKSLISDFSRSYGLEVRMLESYLKRNWPEIVGLPIAAHTWPDSIKFRKLWVAAENSVWLQQLVFLKPVLFEKIKSLANGSLISDVGFRVGEIPRLPQPAPTSPKEEEPHSEIINFAKELTASIQNPKLRDRLTRTITKSLSST